jgi:hypothetical protein
MNNIKIIREIMENNKDISFRTIDIMEQVKFLSNEEFMFLMTHTPGKEMLFEFFMNYVEKIELEEEFEDLQENIKFIFRQRKNWNESLEEENNETNI